MKLYCDPPDLDWRETGPVARDFADIYFSAEDGLAETRAVFLEGCGLPEGWAERQCFVIGELGFGTGLNFLAAWQLWNETRPANGWLHFVSVEKFPFRREIAKAAFVAFPELAELSRQLLAKWPQPLKGPHRLRFDDHRVTLTVFHDDIASALTQIETKVDAWFLDGFAPASNAAMWADHIWPGLARLSRPGARVATFTVAGVVRRGLQSAGFKVEKKPGFGRKRERLEAVLEDPGGDTFPTPFPRVKPHAGPILIRGGGVAGASLAYALHRRGREAVIADPKGLAGGASGAPSGLVTPRLENADRPHVRATLAAFEYARALYSAFGLLEEEGALRLFKDDDERTRYVAIAGAMGEGYDVREDGLWMERAGRLNPAEIVKALSRGTRVIRNLEAAPRASLIIDCRGPDAAMTDLAPGAGRVAVWQGVPPGYPLVWGGYVSAMGDGQVLVGATHEKGADPGSAENANAKLFQDLMSRCPDIAAGLTGEPESWSGVRATTPDRLPVYGSLPPSEFSERWASSARGGPLPEATETEIDTPPHIVLSGFGSRGFAHAPLLAEALASDLCAEPSPLEQSGRQALHPARFAFRRLKRSGI